MLHSQDQTGHHVVVVGAGISGMTAAYRLERLAQDSGTPLSVTLLEAGERAGGVVHTEFLHGALIEHGPESFTSEKQEILALVDELGLRSQLIESSDQSKQTLIAWNRRLHPVPEGVVLFAPTKFSSMAWSPLFSPLGKLRMALDLFIPPRAPEAGDESLASFVRRRLGNEALERLAEPLLGAIYSARIEELSAAAVIPNLKALEQKSGSLIRGLLQQRAKRQTAKVKAPLPARFLSLRYGLESLIDALLSRLAPATLRLNCPVEAIAPGLQRRWRVSLTGGEVIETDAVVLAVPAPVAARLIAGVSEQAAQYLERISYSDAVIVNAMFERAAIRHDLRASGFVLPLKQRRYLRACTFASVKFCERAPAGAVTLRLFGGGQDYASESELTDRLLEDASNYLGLSGQPVFVKVTRHANALPQYTLGHLERIRALEQELHGIKGFEGLPCR